MAVNNHKEYVFDSGPLIDLKNYPRDIFPTVWSQLEYMFQSGRITSCHEVYREIENFDDEIASWVKNNKDYFHRPSLSEQRIVTSILAKHPELIRQSNIVSGKPVADPFVIAQAKYHKRTLVHREKAKPNAHNIPTICATEKIPNIDLFQFFRDVQWTF